MSFLFAAVALLPFATLPASSQPPAAAFAPPPLAFSVVSVKSNKSDSGQNIDFPRDGDGITIRHLSLESLFMFAYGIHSRDIFSGLPVWAGTEDYDIQAKVSEQDLAAYRKLTDAQRRSMLQAVLADSFHLKCHYETRETAIYALIIAKDGPRIKQVAVGATHQGTLMQGRALYATRAGELVGQEIDIATFASAISGQAGRQVVDKTGLTDVYDFTLHWTPDSGLTPAASAGATEPADTGPSLFTAVQEQLGLRLEPQKMPMPFLIVDHIERPSE